MQSEKPRRRPFFATPAQCKLWTACLVSVLMVGGLLVGACPETPRPKAPARKEAKPPSYPYRGTTTQVEGRVHVFDVTKTRALGVVFSPASGGLVQPAGILGLDPRRGTVQWTKPVQLELRNPALPWTFEIARNVTVVAAWTKDHRIRAFDIYGRDAWESSLVGVLGVATLGEGFVTAKGSKIFYMDRQNGKSSEIVDLGAPISAPLVVLPEGEVVALTGDFLVGVNLDAPMAQKVIFRHRIETEEGLEPLKPQTIMDTIIVGSRALPLVIKTEVSLLDPNTLKPRWKKLLPGRVRSHDAVLIKGEEIRVANRQEGAPDMAFVMRQSDGQVVSQQESTARRNCYYGTKQMYCVTPKGVTAYDRKSMAEAWKREMLDDVTGNLHFASGDTFYIAEGPKVVGVQETGRVTFSFEPKAPPHRPRVNRILGLVEGVLILTAADWVTGRGLGQVLGVSVSSSKQVWAKSLVAPAYSEKAAVLVGDRVLWADGTHVSACRAATGGLSGRWPHLLRAPDARIPTMGHQGDQAWVLREGKLGFLNTKTGQSLWRHDVGTGKVVAGGATHLYVKGPTGAIHALENKRGTETWKVPWDSTLAPKVLEVPGGTILSHHERALIIETATGKQLTEFKPGGWHLQMADDAPVLVRVVTFRPKSAGLVQAVSYSRDERKASRTWTHRVPHHKSPPVALDPSASGAFPWFHAASDLVMLPQEGGRCLATYDLVDGRQRWRSCDLAWIAPPQAHGPLLFMATGPIRAAVPEDRQGLFSLDTGSGETTQLFRVPKQGEDRQMWPQYGPMFGGQFFVLTQEGKLRQLLVAKP